MGRSNNPKKFLAAEEQGKVLAAIAQAEDRTSGEIRLHIEGKCPTDEVLDHAKELFSRLEMEKTEQRNGVLIYLATASRRFAILGDEGIDRVVPDNFWMDVKDVMASRFQEGEFGDGLVQGGLTVGVGTGAGNASFSEVVEGDGNYFDLNPFQDVSAQFDFLIRSDPTKDPGGGAFVLRIRAAYHGAFNGIGTASDEATTDSELTVSIGVVW